MSCNIEKKNILGKEYSCQQWSAVVGLKMQAKLIEYGAGTFFQFIASLKSDFKDAIKNDANVEDITDYMDAEKIVKAVDTLFSSHNSEEIVQFIIDFILEAELEIGKEKFQYNHIDENFSGDNLIGIYQLFLFVVSTNYKNLFKGQQLSLG